MEIIQPVALELQTKGMRAARVRAIAIRFNNLLAAVVALARLALLELLIQVATVARELHQQLQAHRLLEGAVEEAAHLAPKGQVVQVAAVRLAQMEQAEQQILAGVVALAH